MARLFPGSGWVFALLFPFSVDAAGLVNVPQLGLRVAPGFRVNLFSDAAAANDIQAMTIDSHGRVVVTGPGYIKTLLDQNKDGVADGAVLFASTQTGGMGMAFDGPDLMFVGDGALSRYRDNDGDGKADGAPQKLFPFEQGEHGAHGVRRGPDGWWYLVAGNDARVGLDHINTGNSPVRNPEGGAFLRISPDGRQSEVIAHGFRNPYDFDFHWTGEILTYDSDTERDQYLPWYKPTRLYQVNYGAHHGWRLKGYIRSWSKPDYFEDSVEMMTAMGRGSPTGVTAYRHHLFPYRYQNGFFACDWTFGRVYFFAPQPGGSTMRAAPEIFLESVGTSGFAPTDLAVAPDGSLLVSTGGRHTRGAVYRISFVGVDASGGNIPGLTLGLTSKIEDILRAPQPLESWSRTIWVPEAKNLGRLPFRAAMLNEQLDVQYRLRAVEILTDLFGGLTLEEARAASRSQSYLVRARVAWSAGRKWNNTLEPVLAGLVRDGNAVVVRTALEAMVDHVPDIQPFVSMPLIASALTYPDKRVRTAAYRGAASLSADRWAEFPKQIPAGDPRAVMGLAFATLCRFPGPQINAAAVRAALRYVGRAGDAELRRQALRLIELALGDVRLNRPTQEVFTGYEAALDLSAEETMTRALKPALRSAFPTGDPAADTEISRLLAMLEDDDPVLPGRVLSQVTATSSPESDFHYLIVLSRLAGARSEAISKSTAEALLGLNRKLDGRQFRTKQQWDLRFGEMFARLVERDPGLGSSLLARADFVSPANAQMAVLLNPNDRIRAAEVFLKRIADGGGVGLNLSILELLQALPSALVKPLARQHWNEGNLRDGLVLLLAEQPDPADRERILAGLESTQARVRRTCLDALLQLPPDPNRTAEALAQFLSRLVREPSERKLRELAVECLGRQLGKTFAITEPGPGGVDALERTYDPLLRTLKALFPDMAKGMEAQGADAILASLAGVRWDRGDASAGAVLFSQRCAVCHQSGRAFGPDLGGVVNRLSREDLFAAIADPSRDVAPAYQVERIRLRNGETRDGMVVFESADGLMLQTAPLETLRLDFSVIASREKARTSMMPSGLLNGLGAADYANLYAYLRGI